MTPVKLTIMNATLDFAQTIPPALTCLGIIPAFAHRDLQVGTTQAQGF